MKTVFEYFPIFFKMGEGNKAFELHFNSLKNCEVKNLNEAKILINLRIDSTMLWINSFRQ